MTLLVTKLQIKLLVNRKKSIEIPKEIKYVHRKKAGNYWQAEIDIII